MKKADITNLSIDEKVARVQKLLRSLAEDSFGYECNPWLWEWLMNMADEIETRCA